MRKNDKEGLDLDEATPNGITVGLGSHGTHASTLTEEKYCKRPLVQS